MAGTPPPDPGWKGRLLRGLALSMAFSGLFGVLAFLDGCFSGQILLDPQRTVSRATGITVSTFWPCFLLVYLVWIRKTVRRRKHDWRTLRVEEKRVGRVHQLLQARRHSG